MQSRCGSPTPRPPSRGSDGCCDVIGDQAVSLCRDGGPPCAREAATRGGRAVRRRRSRKVGSGQCTWAAPWNQEGSARKTMPAARKGESRWLVKKHPAHQQPLRGGRSSGTLVRLTNSLAKALKRWMSAKFDASPSEARTAPPEGSPIAST